LVSSYLILIKVDCPVTPRLYFPLFRNIRSFDWFRKLVGTFSLVHVQNIRCIVSLRGSFLLAGGLVRQELYQSLSSARRSPSSCSRPVRNPSLRCTLYTQNVELNIAFKPVVYTGAVCGGLVAYYV
jgi:hypothetical protein